MNPYKKRAKGDWTQGKAHKGDGQERQFSKKEISEAIAEDEEDFLYKYKKSAKNKNEKARLEYRIRWCEEHITFWKRVHEPTYRRYKVRLREYRKDLKKLLNKGDKK